MIYAGQHTASAYFYCIIIIGPTQVTSDGGGGLVSARDFVFASKKGYLGETFVMGGRSVEYSEAPSSGKIVRAVNGPGCQMVSPGSEENVCHVVWLMDCDYKVGWLFSQLVISR